MGKRELVLVLAFLAVGAIVYQVTAPPLAPGQHGVSVGGLFTNLRRAVSRGGHATITTTHSEPIDESISALHVNTRLLDLRVIGEDRADLAVELTVTSDGMNDSDAANLARQVTAVYTHTGNELVLTMDYPSAGAQRSAVVAHVPRRLTLRVDPKSGRLEASNVAAVDVKNNRGNTHIAAVAGKVDATVRAGSVAIEDAGSLHLSTVSGDGTISRIGGMASLELTGSELTLSDIKGPMDVRSRGGRLKLKGTASLTGLLRVDSTGGALDIDGLETEARIDGRNTEMHIAMARAVVVTIYNSADDITIVPPPDGYTLDAVASDGELSIDSNAGHGVAVAKAADEHEQSATGPMNGGGPMITLRNTRGDISIRSRSRN